MYYEVFFISVILQGGCNEIESKIVNCIMILVARRVGKRRWEQKNVKIVETDMDIWHKTYEKTVIRIKKKQCK